MTRSFPITLLLLTPAVTVVQDGLPHEQTQTHRLVFIQVLTPVRPPPHVPLGRVLLIILTAVDKLRTEKLLCLSFWIRSRTGSWPGSGSGSWPGSRPRPSSVAVLRHHKCRDGAWLLLGSRSRSGGLTTPSGLSVLWGRNGTWTCCCHHCGCESPRVRTKEAFVCLITCSSRETLAQAPTSTVQHRRLDSMVL